MTKHTPDLVVIQIVTHRNGSPTDIDVGLFDKAQPLTVAEKKAGLPFHLVGRFATIADAEHFAAMPDMLAACKAAISALECNPKFMENEPTIRQLRAAIAKANAGGAAQMCTSRADSAASASKVGAEGQG